MVFFGVRFRSVRVVRYQYVGKGNAKLSRWWSKPTESPNTNGFAFWWNVGLKG